MFNSEPIMQILGRALDVCALKHSVHTANIANAGVDGYHRMEVSFDSELQRLTASDSNSMSNSLLDTIAKPQVIQSADAAVRLDQEMGLMAQNAIRYQTLIGAFEKNMSLLRLAIKEGRGA